jgi:integrase
MLTAKKVERTRKPGRYRCGIVKGLLLQVTDSGAKSWVLRYELRGRERWMGLGSASEFNLKEARERARTARQQLADGIDPLVGKRATAEAARLAEARKLTFRQAAEQYFNQHETKWSSVHHREQFLTTLKAHVFPSIGDMDVAAIETADVLRTFEPIWKTKTSTADRTRSRVEQVIDWAVIRGHRTPGTNPARWKGHLDQVLPAPRKVAPVEHHPAMDFRALPQFMAELRQVPGTAARALEFLIHVCARSGEVRGATWDEIDFDNKIWIVPGDRTKTRKEHRVPLSPACIELLEKLPRQAGNHLIFNGPKSGSGLSHTAMTYVMWQLGQRDVTTIHGFRSSFSNWAHEQTAHSAHTIEISLAHNVGNEVERAYRRTDMIAKRRQLMEQWSKFCLSPPSKISGDVVPLRGGQ